MNCSNCGYPIGQVALHDGVFVYCSDRCYYEHGNIREGGAGSNRIMGDFDTPDKA